MAPPTIFYDTPIWALYIVTVIFVLLSVEAGYRLGSLRRRGAAHEGDAPIGGLVAATLGLLAFLLAFTFGAAATRFDARKQAVLQEANAIGTAYLRADLLPETQRTNARSALVSYTTLRAQGVTALLTTAAMAESSAAQDKLWSAAASAGSQSPDSPVTALFVQAVNEVIDLDAARIAAGRNRIPDTIWITLYALTMFSIAAVGYHFGLSGARSWGETILLVLAFSLVILLIADLDRPNSGTVQVSQQPMLDLLSKIAPPAP